METEKSTPFRYIRFFILTAAAALTVVAIIFHSSIISPSIWQDESQDWPMRVYSLTLNGEAVDRTLPGRFTLEPGDTLVLEGPISTYNRLKNSFLIPTDAPAFRIYLDGELYASDGTAIEGNPIFNNQHSGSIVHLGTLPSDRDISTIRIEYSNPTERRASVGVDRIIIGSVFDILSHFQAVLLLIAILILTLITIVLISIFILMALLKSRSSAHVAIAIAAEVLILIQCISTTPFRMFVWQNATFWQLLDQASHALTPAIILMLLRKEVKIRVVDTWAVQLAVLVPPFVLIIAAAGVNLEPHLFHDLLHLTKPLSLLAMCALIVIMSLSLKKKGGANLYHHLASSFFIALSIVLEIAHPGALNVFMGLHATTIALRLIAIVCYIIFTVADYLGREMLTIGQSGLDDMLYRDLLTGCYNRRNLEHFKNSSEMSRPCLIITYDINDLKLVNDCFGHSEGDRVFTAFGSFIRSHLPSSSGTFRIGGDEFVSIIRKEHAPEDAAAFTLSLTQAFEKETVYSTGIAAGWAWYNGDGKAAFEKAMAEADKRMYEMKRQQKASNPYPIWGGRIKGGR